MKCNIKTNCKYQYADNDGGCYCGNRKGKCMSLTMDPGEVIREYDAAKNKKEQVKVLADLNCCTAKEMAQFLADNGCEVDKRYLAKGGWSAAKSTEPEREPEPTAAATAECAMDLTEEEIRILAQIIRRYFSEGAAMLPITFEALICAVDAYKKLAEHIEAMEEFAP